MAGRVCGHHDGGHGRLALRAGSADMAGRVGRQGGPGGAGRASRIGQGGATGDRQGGVKELVGRVRNGLGLVVPAVNVPMNGFLRCVWLRSWHVG